MNSTEWEITIYFHDFEESWMRYGLGRGSDIKILTHVFQISHTDFSGTTLMTYKDLLYRENKKIVSAFLLKTHNRILS